MERTGHSRAKSCLCYLTPDKSVVLKLFTLKAPFITVVSLDSSSVILNQGDTKSEKLWREP